MVIYTELSKALYRTLQADMLLWKDLSTFMINELGFITNPYDWCVINKVINGDQCTIGWHVNDLKISHVDEVITESIVEVIGNKYGKEAPLVVHHGPIHEYLGMTIDYTKQGKVCFNMPNYIDQLIDEIREALATGVATSPAANHLFNTNDDAPKLSTSDAILFHHLVAKFLYLAKWVWADILLTVSFLCMQVQQPDEDDFRKLR